MRILIVLMLLVTCAGAEPIQWTVESGGNGHWYEVIVGTFRWDEAQADAETRSWLGLTGHLASITSEVEGAWIWDTLAPNRCWLGGYQSPGSPEPDGGWTWVTGETWLYTNWAEGEPNNHHSGTENSLVYTDANDGTWNDRVNTDTAGPGYLIEYEDMAISRYESTWGEVKKQFR